MPETTLPQIIVAGDVCLDIVALPVPAPRADSSAENWRLTGEKRTYYLRGGAMLLAQMVARATQDRAKVDGPFLPTPSALASCCDKKELLDTLFERLTRDEVVHSLLEAGTFPAVQGQKDAEPTAIRLSSIHGYSGPVKQASGEVSPPSLTPQIPDDLSPPALLVLDDAGNGFRWDAAQWPAAIKTPSTPPPSVLLKLHCPLPVQPFASEIEPETDLWSELMAKHRPRLVVVLNINDLREAGANISARLSWERTALDFAAQLHGNELFQPLQNCQWLIVQCGLEGALCWHCPDGDAASPRLWLVYDPARIEDSYAADFPGGMTGQGSAFTAGLAARLVREPLPVPAASTLPQALYEGIVAGLRAARTMLQTGFDPSKPNTLAYPLVAFDKAPPAPREVFATIAVPLPDSLSNPDGDRWTILQEILPGGEVLDGAAQSLVFEGKPTAELGRVPLGKFGALATYDRREIEAYRALSNLMREYLARPKPERPLCLAVFGPPGSGKSFGVREVAGSVAQGDTVIAERVFNLSQFQTPAELGHALHLVRDDVIASKVPLVFFDEFDSTVGQTELFWLKYLLAPMQDGKFFDAGADHHIGKAIFVFAGGTCDTFEIFAHIGTHEEERAKQARFREAKGPDFVSRLRGTLNVPGVKHGDDYRGPALLRRAGALRFQLWKKAPDLFDSAKQVRLDAGLLRAFLHVPDFEHGMRSVESLLEMSQLAGRHSFHPGCLPAPSQLRLHVTPTQTDTPGLGFLDLVQRESPFPPEARAKIAEAIHLHYLEKRREKGEYEPAKASHQEWPVLSPFYKDSNARQADDIPRKLRLMGLEWQRADDARGHPTLDDFKATVKDRLEAVAQREHDRWLAERRLAGWTYGEKEDIARQQSPTMLKWKHLPENEKDKDRDSIRGIPRYLKAGGYVVLTPLEPKSTRPSA